MCKWHCRARVRSGVLTRTALVCSLSPAFNLPQALAGQSLDIHFEPHSRLVSVSADAAPLAEVLSELGERAGVQIRIDPAVSHKVMQHFRKLPLERAIERLAGPHGTLFVYHGAVTGSSRLHRVHVMARKKAETAEPPAVAPDFDSLDEYGRAWLLAHHRDLTHFPEATLFNAAISWQSYLSRLPLAQRERLHERMLQTRSREKAFDQLAASRIEHDSAVR